MSRRFIFAFILSASFLALGSAHAQWQSSPGEIPLLRLPELPSAETLPAGTLRVERVEQDGIGDAQKYFLHRLTFGLGYIPQNALRNAEQQRDAMRTTTGKGMSAQSAQPQWTFVGPSNIGGRVTALAIDPTNANIIYAGAAEGGVWKTTDAGTSWTPLTDKMQAVSMGALGIDPQHPDTVYAGTGELANGSASYSGDGLLRSTNGGATWSDVGPPNVAAYTSVIVNPRHSNLVYAAAGKAGGGVLRSTDGGLTWQWLGGGIPKNAGVSELALSMNGDVAILYAGVVSNGVYRSTDGGDTWTKLGFSGTPLGSIVASDFVRISLDVDPANWQNVVVLDVDGNNGAGADDFGGLVQSNDGGDTWTDIGGQFESGQQSPLAEGNGVPPQGWYDAYIRVDPSDFNHMLLGGVTLASTRNGGQSWSIHGSQELHVDHHAAAFAPSDPAQVYAGSDGGVFYSPNGGDQFNSATFPLAITQFYGIGIDQTQDDLTYGGTQDNGSMSGSTGVDWGQFEGGDGSYTLVDPKNSSYIYWEYTQGAPQVYGNPSASTSGLSGSIDSVVWLNPLAADTKNDIIYWGCNRLAYTTNQGQSWHNCAQPFGSASGQTTISSIDAFGDGKTVLVGTGGGLVYVTANNGISFTDVSKGLPGRVVTCVRFDPSSATTFYATMSGFGAGHVFKTTDNGTDWTNISSTLPDIPVNSIVMDPQNPSVLYIGTDVGVFLSPNDGGEWIPYGSGLPNTSVVYMEIQKQNRILRAGTQGRSIWQIPLQDDVTGIVSPVQQTVWTIGDTASIQWHGFTGPVSVDLSVDGGTTWQNLATGSKASIYSIANVIYSPAANALVRVSDAGDTVVSPLFRINQQKLGDQVATVGELPMYLYDIAYDKDDNVLWATTYDNSGKLYKIDPDKGTLLDSVKVAVLDKSVMAGLTGIKYDPASKHLFIQQVNNTSDPYAWNSLIYEVATDGSIINHAISPAEYGTGIYVKGDSLFVADRMTAQIQVATLENWTQGKTAFEILNPLDFSNTRPMPQQYVYGPRGLTYDSKLGEFLLAFTEFTGTRQNSTFNGSDVLFLDTASGAEQSATTILDGEQTSNIRGMEYDPRGTGNTAWITILSGANSAKLVKIALADGPSGGAAGEIAVLTLPYPIDFGAVDTGKSKTLSVELYNVNTTPDSIASITLDQEPNGPYSLGSPETNIVLKDSMNISLSFAPHAPGTFDNDVLAVTLTNDNVTFLKITGLATISGAGVSPNSNPEDWSLEISPNPARDFADLTINAAKSDVAAVHIYDVTGRELRSASLGTLVLGGQEMELSTAGLPSGMYFVRITGTNGEICSAKLVIAR